MARKFSAKNYENLTEQEKGEYNDLVEKRTKRNVVLSRIITVCIVALSLFVLFIIARIAWIRFACIVVRDNEVSIVRDYTLFDDELKIPDTMFGHPVTSIGYNAFKGNKNIRSVEIPDSVTFIDGCAFIECDSLESAVIPDSVTEMGNFVFGGCDKLEYVSLSNSVLSIPDGTFDNCISLESVSCSDSITSIGTRAFYNCESLETFAIPDSVTEMGNNVFTGCTSLGDVTIGKGVRYIAYGMFMDCGLEELVIPYTVEAIDSSAFMGSELTVTAQHAPEYYGLSEAPEGVTWIVD